MKLKIVKYSLMVKNIVCTKRQVSDLIEKYAKSYNQFFY